MPTSSPLKNGSDDSSLSPPPPPPPPSATTTTTTANNNNNDLELGMSVWVRRRGQPYLDGEVAYLGPVQFATGDDWVGIRLLGNCLDLGKNDGSVNGVVYFETTGSRQGLFVRRANVQVKQPFNLLTPNRNNNKKNNNNLARRTTTTGGTGGGGSSSSLTPDSTPTRETSFRTSPTTYFQLGAQDDDSDSDDNNNNEDEEDAFHSSTATTTPTPFTNFFAAADRNSSTTLQDPRPLLEAEIASKYHEEPTTTNNDDDNDDDENNPTTLHANNLGLPSRPWINTSRATMEQQQPQQHDSSPRVCQAVSCTLLIVMSWIPVAGLAIFMMVVSDPKDKFLNFLAAGLLLGQVVIGLGLLLPFWLLGGPNRWITTRASAFLSAYVGLLLLILTLLVVIQQQSSSPSPPLDSKSQILFLAGSGATLLLAILALAISFWPQRKRPISLNATGFPEENGLAEPLLPRRQQQLEQDPLPLMVSEGGHNDNVGNGNLDEEMGRDNMETNPNHFVEENTGRVRGTRRLLQLASSQVVYLYLGCLVLLIRLPFSLAIPHFVSTTLAALGRGEYHQARVEILYLLILGSMDAALDFWCIFLFGYANARIVKNLRVDLFGRLLRMEVAFFDQHNSGTLASRLNSDCSEMASDLTWFFRFSIESVVRISGITAYMLIRSPRLGMCALTIVPVVGIINKFYGDWLRKNAMAVQDALAEANAVAQEALANVRTVIAFAAENIEEEHYRAKIEKQYTLGIQQLFMQGVYYMAVSTFLINTVVQASLLYLGAHLVEANMLTTEVLLAFMLYQGQLQQETLNLFQSYSSLVKSSGAGDKVFALLDRQPPPPAMAASETLANTDTAPEPLAYDIRLEQVSFAYPSRPSQSILDKVVLDIPQGSTVALVGPSGCGKTTVVNLLQRFYDPTEGTILLNGRDLRLYDLQGHRRRIGVVSQDCVLFDGTVLENIIYGSHPRGEPIHSLAILQDAKRAARLAHSDAFIEAMPLGYHTIVGEKGVQLSGGQRQRISIARAIYQRPLLLILDEATSALDRESEQVVQEALDELLQAQRFRKAESSTTLTTTIVIAHRLNTVENADYIAVLSQGRVEEFGSPKELLKLDGGLFRQMVERAQQTGRFAES